MKTTRREFLKLFGLGTLGVIAQPSAALAELTHGASDLTPRERDAVADAMGLRQEQWAGWDRARPGSECTVYTVTPGMTIVGVDGPDRPSFSFPDEDDSLRAWGTGQPMEFTVRGQWIEPTPLDFIMAEAGRGSHLMVDNLGLTIDVGYVNYMAALNKRKSVDSLTKAERRQAFMDELLRERH